jgi:hypothetical protein
VPPCARCAARMHHGRSIQSKREENWRRAAGGGHCSAFK